MILWLWGNFWNKKSLFWLFNNISKLYLGKKKLIQTVFSFKEKKINFRKFVLHKNYVWCVFVVILILINFGKCVSLISIWRSLPTKGSENDSVRLFLIHYFVSFFRFFFIVLMIVEHCPRLHTFSDSQKKDFFKPLLEIIELNKFYWLKNILKVLSLK